MIKGIKKAWDQVVQGVAKPPPDQLLVAAERKLDRLRSIVDVMRSNFTRYTELAIQLGDAGIIISNDVSVFYGNAKAKSRQTSIETFRSSQKSVAVSAVEDFRSQLRAGDNGIVDEFTKWTNEIDRAKLMVADCKRLQQNLFDSRVRVAQSREMLAKKRSKVGGVFGSSAGDIFELERKIPQFESQTNQLESQYNELLKKVDETSTAIVTKRFTTFDRIYVLLMEAQVTFFSKGAEAVGVFQRPITNYRAKFPKSQNTPAAPSKPAPRRHTIGAVKKDSQKGRGTTPEPAVVAQPGASSTPPADSTKPEPVADPIDFLGLLETPANTEGRRTTVLGLPPDKALKEDEKKSKDSPSGPSEGSDITRNRAGSNTMDDFFQSMFDGGNQEKGPTIESVPETVPENKAASNTTEDNLDIFGFRGLETPSKSPGFDTPDVKTSSANDMLNGVFADPKPSSRSSSHMFDPMNVDFVASNPNKDGNLEVPAKPTLQSDESGHRIATDIFNDWGSTRNDRFSAKEQAEIQQKVEEKLQEHRDRIEKEEKLIEAKIDTRDKFEERIKAWSHQNNMRRDLRTLLSTLHNVLWENSKWKTVGLSDVLTPRQIKKQYRKAIMVIHPDRQSDKTLEIQVVAEQCFEIINDAWDDFNKKQ